MGNQCACGDEVISPDRSRDGRHGVEQDVRVEWVKSRKFVPDLERGSSNDGFACAESGDGVESVELDCVAVSVVNLLEAGVFEDVCRDGLVVRRGALSESDADTDG